MTITVGTPGNVLWSHFLLDFKIFYYANLYYILEYLYFDAAIICCKCLFYFSIYRGAINNNIQGHLAIDRGSTLARDLHPACMTFLTRGY